MLDKLEKIAKIISLIAIPFVLWWLGTQYQTADSRNKTAVEYVKLSIAIISNENAADPQLLAWVTETLNYYSEIKLGEPLKQAVATGVANFSPSMTISGWFAVVASLETRNQAIQRIDQLRVAQPELLKSYDFQVYKTQISNLYAVTIGGEASKADAVKRAAQAREAGWVADAFAQRNQAWVWERI